MTLTEANEQWRNSQQGERWRAAQAQWFERIADERRARELDISFEGADRIHIVDPDHVAFTTPLNRAWGQLTSRAPNGLNYDSCHDNVGFEDFVTTNRIELNGRVEYRDLQDFAAEQARYVRTARPGNYTYYHTQYMGHT